MNRSATPFQRVTGLNHLFPVPTGNWLLIKFMALALKANSFQRPGLETTQVHGFLRPCPPVTYWT